MGMQKVWPRSNCLQHQKNHRHSTQYQDFISTDCTHITNFGRYFVHNVFFFASKEQIWASGSLKTAQKHTKLLISAQIRRILSCEDVKHARRMVRERSFTLLGVKKQVSNSGSEPPFLALMLDQNWWIGSWKGVREMGLHVLQPLHLPSILQHCYKTWF